MAAPADPGGRRSGARRRPANLSSTGEYFSVGPEDAALVRRCLGGEAPAFEILLERYEKPVFNAAYRMVDDRSDAADITQTVFLKAFEKLRTFDPRYRFYSWIYRIAINETLNFLERRGREAALDEGRPARVPNPEDTVGERERDRLVRRTLMELETPYRTVIVLRHFIGCSYRDIGAVLEIPEKTVKSRLFTARQLLRDALVGKGVLHA